jgi:hypothetical protein
MTMLYRLSEDSPPFADGGFWTMEPSEAPELARLESGGDAIGERHALYAHEADLEGAYHYEITTAVELAESGGLPMDLTALAEGAAQKAPEDAVWVRLLVARIGYQHWRGAFLQLRAGLIAATPIVGDFLPIDP